MIEKQKPSFTKKLGKLFLSATLVVSAFTAQLAVPKTEAAAAPNDFISNFYVNSFKVTPNSSFENITFTVAPFNMSTNQLSTSEGLSVTKILENSGTRYIGAMAVSSNGNYMAFAYKRNGNDTIIYIVDRINNRIRSTFTQQTFYPTDAAFSPDGSKLILLGRNSDNDNTAKSIVLSYNTSDLANNSNANFVVNPNAAFEVTNRFQPSSIVAVGDYYYLGFKAANGGYPTPPSIVELYSISNSNHVKSINLSKDSAFSLRVNQLIVSPDGTKIYAHEITDRKVSVINTITNTVESIHELDGTFFENADSTGTALSPDGETFYVAYKKKYTHPSKSGLAKYDITNNFELEGTVEIDLPSDPNDQYAGLFPHNVGVSPEGSRVFVHATTNTGGHKIITLNEDTLEKVSETTLDNNSSYAFPTKQLNFPVQYGYSATLEIDADDINLTSTLPFTPSIEAVYNTNITTDVVGGEITATSNDTSIVEINNNNQLVARSSGNTTVTLEYRGATVTVPVTVDLVPATIGFPSMNESLSQGASLQLEVLGFNSAGDPVGGMTDNITFSTTATNITLSNTGLVTALEPGSATVYAQFINPINQTQVTAGVTITVSSATLTDFTAVDNTVSLTQGQPAVVDFNAVYGQNTLAIDSLRSGVTLQSSDTEVVQVINKQLLGLKNGSVTITASYNGKQTTFTASVDHLIDRLEFDSTEYLLAPLASEAITITAHYEDGSSAELLDGSGVGLSLSNNIASVALDMDDKKYYLSTLGTFSEGEATLTATIGNISVSAPVKTYYSMIGIYVENNPLEVTVGGSETLTLVREIDHNGAIQYLNDSSNVTLSSNNTAIATVDADGQVNGVAVGTTTIDVTFDNVDGNTYSTTVDVEVKEPTPNPTPTPSDNGGGGDAGGGDNNPSPSPSTSPNPGDGDAGGGDNNPSPSPSTSPNPGDGDTGGGDNNPSPSPSPSTSPNPGGGDTGGGDNNPSPSPSTSPNPGDGDTGGGDNNPSPSPSTSPNPGDGNTGGDDNNPSPSPSTSPNPGGGGGTGNDGDTINTSPSPSPSPTPEDETAPSPSPTPETNTASASFTDVSNHWAASSIARGVELGLIQGYSDGTFRPEDDLTRGQFAVMLYRGLGLTGSEEALFSDNVPAWAKDAVNAVAKAGYIQGYPDGSFKQEQAMTRGELAVIIARVLNLQTEQAASFNDAASIPTWANSAVNAVSNAGIMSGYTDGSFRADAVVTRAEALVVLLRALNYMNKQ